MSRGFFSIPYSIYPNGSECIKFLERQAKSLDLPVKVYNCAGNPVLVITWVGKDPNLPTIWLNSHTDVVPVYEDKWAYKPFGADMDNEGNIYARGAQDDKSIGVQYLEAIRRLKKEGASLTRTVHIAFVPEEESSGVSTMAIFTTTDDFAKLNVGFALDEGDPTIDDAFSVYYGERFQWEIRVRCPGQQGHGSLLLPHPPGNKIGIIINKFNDFRAEQLKKLSEDPKLDLGDVTSINLTKLEGGVQGNVVPPDFSATFDIRIPATVDTEHFLADIKKWCKEVGEDISIEFISKESSVPNTKIDESNIFWVVFKKTMDDLKLQIKPCICYGATDARHLRNLGIPALGFSPMNRTAIRMHDNDEYLNAKVFLKGIEIYTKIIPAIANII